MKQHSENNSSRFLPLKTIFVMTVVFSTIWMASSFRNRNDFSGNIKNKNKTAKDSIESVKAFMKVYKVLMSPRCMNCHPAGDAPLQGDDNHIHTMNVVRGPDGARNTLFQII